MTALINRYLNHFAGRRVWLVGSSEGLQAARSLVSGDRTGDAVHFIETSRLVGRTDLPDAALVCEMTQVQALATHAALTGLKRKGIPVVFAMTREIFADAPTPIFWGLNYAGMFRQAASYLEGHRVRRQKGERLCYAEFGVFDGRTFTLAWQTLRGLIDCFMAFDSFAGIKGVLDEEKYRFGEGDYFCNQETFEANLAVAGVERERVRIVAGAFQEKLAGKVDFPGPVILAHIDSDVYEAAKCVLDGLKDHLVDGSMILFDEYDQMWTDDRVGERRAVREWLRENPTFRLNEYRAYAGAGRSFVFYRDE